MSGTNQALEKQFKQRYVHLKFLEHLITDSIRILSLSTDYPQDEAHAKIQEFISELISYDIHTEDFNETKQVLEDYINSKIPHKVARAHLNYLLDIVGYKANRMLFIKDVFECYF